MIVTLGRHSLGRFMPGERISQAHGTVRPVDPATGAANALAFALYHPAAALRTPDIERTSYQDVAQIPATLLAARARREAAPVAPSSPVPPVPSVPDPAVAATPDPAFLATSEALAPDDQLTLF